MMIIVVIQLIIVKPALGAILITLISFMIKLLMNNFTKSQVEIHYFATLTHSFPVHPFSTPENISTPFLTQNY